MAEKQDYLESAINYVDNILLSPKERIPNKLEVAFAMLCGTIALVERLDTMNDKLERIASTLEKVTDGDNPLENSLNVYVTGRV